MTNEDALRALRQHTQEFLKKHRLQIAAHFHDSENQSVWFFNDGQNFGGHDSFKIDGDKPGIGDPVKLEVYGVRVYNFAEINVHQLPPAELPRGSGDPDFMATVKLTGCSVVTQKRHSDGGPLVAHIQPDRDHGQSGGVLQEALHGARFEGSRHSTEVYGRLDYGDNDATVIALRKDSGWNLYVQEWGKTSGKEKIDKVKKFPLG